MLVQVDFLFLTPKAKRVQQLRGQGKTFKKALAIADREFTSDGISLKPASPNVAALASGPAQMGEVQI